jgi:hypothetical protein
MNYNQIIKTLYIAVILLLAGCDGISKQVKQNSSSTEYKTNESSEGNINLNISGQTTNNLCQVARFLDNQNFNGDFYVNNGSIKWGMGVDSIEIPKEIISLLLNEKIEYVARARGIIEFGFFPNKNGEHGLLLNTKPINPLITSGNVEPKFKKLDNSKCMDFNWYYQTYD